MPATHSGGRYELTELGRLVQIGARYTVTAMGRQLVEAKHRRCRSRRLARKAVRIPIASRESRPTDEPDSCGCLTWEDHLASSCGVAE